MPEPSDALKNELNQLLVPIYYSAFHPYQYSAAVLILFGILGMDQGAVGTYIGYGLLLLGPGWIGSVVYVNRTYRSKKDAFTEEASAVGRKIFGAAGEETTSFTIEHSYGNVRLVRPNQVVEPISIIVGDTSMLVYNDSKLDFDLLDPDFGTGTREFFFDSIASVNYEHPYFEIKLVDGDHAQYRSSRKPDDVLHELQRRIREYKQQPA